MAEIVHLDNTEQEYRYLAYMADSIIAEFLFREDVYKEETGGEAGDLTLSEYLAHTGASKLMRVKMSDLMSLLCKFTEQLDPEEETVKLL